MKTTIFENHSQCNKLIAEFQKRMLRADTMLQKLIAQASSEEKKQVHLAAQNFVSELIAFIDQSQLRHDPHEPFIEALQHTLTGLQHPLFSQ